MVEHEVRSVLAVPIRRRDELLGVLYLENDLLTGAFKRDRVEMLRLLSGQIGVALDNARLYREAQDYIRARDEFLLVASHELRTPLTPLVLSIERLQRDGRPPTTDLLLPHFRIAERQVGRLKQLVDALFELAEIRVGRMELTPEEVDLAALARDVVGRMQAPRRSPGRIDIVAPAQVMTVGDRSRLERVISSLVSNALKFGRGEPVELAVEQRGSGARITVRDRGIGIAPDRLSQIFEQFQHAVRVEEYAGLGLGLYVVRAIVEAHGGQVRAESTLGAGSTFIVDLPGGVPPSVVPAEV